jgi:Transposase zinc-binding domain/Putative transposase
MTSERAASRRAPPFIDPPGYTQHRPEQTLLYQLVEQHYPVFLAVREAAGRPLPGYVQQEFEKYLKCGRLEHGFLRVRCESCHAEKLVAFSCKGRGFCPSCGARRMAEGAALLADEVLPPQPLRQWVLSLPFALRFLLATNPKVLTRVLGIVYRTISSHLLRKARLTRATGRSGRALERAGLLERDVEQSYLALEAAAGSPMDDLLGHSITYRVAVGPRAGQKVFALQTVPAQGEAEARPGVAQYAGFSLHAGTAVEGEQREKLERLARYVTRPPVAVERLGAAERNAAVYSYYPRNRLRCAGPRTARNSSAGR